ncbi:hypothetical protein Bca52824_024708 [Brassica carinata]|uniref:Patellin-1-6 C-terminal GOLD domain-containing protein n=1 Tax=Brassica carinata TaxID=52824 RepID=A0A8X7VKW4_BRACI|nr:hypothetical protein Bca52824_024708 [Brassica carinata]
MRGSSGITRFTWGLRDLLVSQGTQPIGPIPPRCKGEIDIENLVTLKVSDFDQVFKLYKIGCRDRATASTNSNSASRADHTDAASSSPTPTINCSLLVTALSSTILIFRATLVCFTDLSLMITTTTLQDFLEIRVIGCEVSYKAEFMPEEKDAYRLVVQKPRKMKPADELMCLYM